MTKITTTETNSLEKSPMGLFSTIFVSSLFSQAIFQPILVRLDWSRARLNDPGVALNPTSRRPSTPRPSPQSFSHGPPCKSTCSVAPAATRHRDLRLRPSKRRRTTLIWTRLSSSGTYRRRPTYWGGECGDMYFFLVFSMSPARPCHLRQPRHKSLIFPLDEKTFVCLFPVPLLLLGHPNTNDFNFFFTFPLTCPFVFHLQPKG